MKSRGKRILFRVVTGFFAFLLIFHGVLAMAGNRWNYPNYFGGVVFAPMAILGGILILVYLVFDARRPRSRKRRKSGKAKEGMFVGPLKDWEKW